MDVFTLTESDYRHLAELVYKKSGIHLGPGKKELIRNRFSKILREKGLNSFGDYYDLVSNDSTGREIDRMINAISTNVTSFFREPVHFEFVSTEVLPGLIDKKQYGNIRLWSAGCSTGEEPYSLSICLQEFQEGVRHLSVNYNILATDLSTQVIDLARKGVYDEYSVDNISMAIKKKYFKKGTGRNSGFVRLKSSVMAPVSFSQMNLMKSFVFEKKFDVIFCRNVLIYFTEEDQKNLVDGFYNNLKKGGYLFIGHSESLMKFRNQFEYVRPTIYIKPE